MVMAQCGDVKAAFSASEQRDSFEKLHKEFSNWFAVKGDPRQGISFAITDAANMLP